MDAAEARDALDQIGGAQRRSSALTYSAGAGPYLIMWGVIWFVCSVASQVSPQYGWISWPVGGLAGIGYGVLAGSRAKHGGQGVWGGEAKAYFGRWLGATFAMLAYYQAVSLLFGLQSQPKQVLLAGLTVGLGYVLIGIWQAAPMAYAGLALCGLLTAGWFLAPAWFLLWFGIVGGGTLVFTGLWMRSLKG